VLYHADCRDLLPIVADAVITDPPYGMNWNTDSTRFSGPRLHGPGRDRERIRCDDEPFDPAPWLDYPAVVLFGYNHYAQRLPVGTTLVWLKRLDPAFGSFLSDAELAWMKGGHGVYAYRKCFPHEAKKIEAGGSVHPSQKPVSVMAWCIKKAKVRKGATILDPYMGSGTTGIACIRLGMNFIGIELDETYYKTACDRITHELDGALL
jgi:tRNA G10  N-methylase Trm11